MNTKNSLAALIAAAAMAAGGLALAQANPPTSTPGAGCTATANAMKGGNMGGSPSKTACAHEGSATTAATVAPVNPTPMAAAGTTTATPTDSSASTSSSSATTAGASANTGAMAPVRVARADRN